MRVRCARARNCLVSTARKLAKASGPSAAASAEAMSALTNLGYGPSEAAAAVAEASALEPAAATAGLIRAALKLLAPKG